MLNLPVQVPTEISLVAVLEVSDLCVVRSNCQGTDYVFDELKVRFPVGTKGVSATLTDR